MIRLVEKYKTQYLIPSYSEDIMTDIKTALAENDTIDIQGAKLSNAVGHNLAIAMEKQGLKVIDSVNPEMQRAIDERIEIVKSRDSVLQELRESFDKVDFSLIKKEEDYIALLQKYKNNPSKIELVKPAGLLTGLQTAWLCNWLFRSTTHEFFISEMFLYIYNFIQAEWLPKAEHHDSYWELTKPGVVLRHVKDGVIEVEGRRPMTEEQFVHTRICLPGELTTKNLLARTNGMFNPEWELVAKKLENTINPVKVEKRSIRDFIPTV